MEREFTNGLHLFIFNFNLELMEENMQGFGERIKCRVREYLNGLMEGSIKELLMIIRKMDMEK